MRIKKYITLLFITALIIITIFAVGNFAKTTIPVVNIFNVIKSKSDEIVQSTGKVGYINVKNVKASFVCTPYNDQVYISARSIDKINVQVIMEQFGGGGHMNLAGAQVRNKTTGEVIVMLKKVIETMIEEGEI